MSNKRIEKACPYLECVHRGSVSCEAGARIGDGRELGRRYARRFCENEAGFRQCSVYLAALEAMKKKN